MSTLILALKGNQNKIFISNVYKFNRNYLTNTLQQITHTVCMLNNMQISKEYVERTGDFTVANHALVTCV